MSVAANSYGSAAGVAGYTPLYVDQTTKLYTTSTTPTLVRVESWVNEVSSIANSALATYRFVVPVSQADCVLMLTGMIEQAVADLCNMTNSSGRFFSEKISPKVSAMGLLRQEIYDWVAMNAIGMENLGATRNADETGGDSVTVGAYIMDFQRHGDDPEITA